MMDEGQTVKTRERELEKKMNAPFSKDGSADFG
jgi:hypothetical protein